MEKTALTISITGAFSYTGRYIAKKLLSENITVKAITNHPRPEVFPSAQIPVAKLQFDNSHHLVSALRGTDSLIITYWVRYPYRNTTHEKAVENIRFLVRCAKEAKVKQIIHISVTNPSIDSDLSYFKGKALAENVISESGIGFSILRPSLVFGIEDILINNIAWLLRTFPFFVLPAPLNYSVQPVFVEDVAQAVLKNLYSTESSIQDIVGNEVYRMDEFVRLISIAIGHPKKMISLPKQAADIFIKTLSLMLHDRVLTHDEMQGLMENRLVSASEPFGKTSFKTWIMQNGSMIGTRYTNDFLRFYSSRP